MVSTKMDVQSNRSCTVHEKTIDTKKNKYIEKLLEVKELSASYGAIVRYLADNAQWKNVGVSQFTLTPTFNSKMYTTLNVTEQESEQAIRDLTVACLLVPTTTKGRYIMNPEFFGVNNWNTITNLQYAVVESVLFPKSYIGIQFEYMCDVAASTCLQHA